MKYFSEFFVSLLLIAFTHQSYGIKSTKQLLPIYQNHRFTFFCEQPYSAKGEIELRHCETCPVSSARIQWMPIVPMQRLGQHLLCYREKICINHQGKRFKGQSCCQQYDPHFQIMSQDLHNFVPESPLLKAKRRQYAFGITSSQTHAKGCHFYIDQNRKIVEPAPHLRGMIARIYLYMRDRYHLPLSEEENALYVTWHKGYAVTPWERERNEKIKAIQGNGNPYISR